MSAWHSDTQYSFSEKRRSAKQAGTSYGEQQSDADVRKTVNPSNWAPIPSKGERNRGDSAMFICEPYNM
jgi:hypothetical protein